MEQKADRGQLPVWQWMKNKNNLIIIVLIGIILLIAAIPTNAKKEGNSAISANKEGENTTELEGRLKAILEKTQGVGAVEVMITQKEEEHAYFSEQKKGGEVLGVLVAAEHGDDAVVIKKIMEAVQALFEVDTHRIKIVKMNLNKSGG
ncbi:MAG: hypothetical protein K2O96_07455 [Lachnospiraceae bacterium]|nr:hypothetical protein [Lachnospiraceae bacterium]